MFNIMNIFKKKKEENSNDSVDIAKYIIATYQENEIYVPSKRVCSLMFFIQSNYLKKYGKVAFKEIIYANPYGVTIDEVRNEFLWANGSDIMADVIKPALDQKLVNEIVLSMNKAEGFKVFDLIQIVKHTDTWLKAMLTDTYRQINNASLQRELIEIK